MSLLHSEWKRDQARKRVDRAIMSLRTIYDLPPELSGIIEELIDAKIEQHEAEEAYDKELEEIAEAARWDGVELDGDD